MADPVLVPVVYKCGHTINVLSPGISDPAGQLAKLYDGRNPLPTDWAVKCWNCGDLFKTQVPAETTEALRKAKKGEQ